MTKTSRPSLTARMVAKERAGLSSSRPSRGDAEAEARLYATLDRWYVPPTMVGPGGMAARTRFFDDQVIAALDRGVRQGVILGAGYDGRALRFGGAGCRWIEVDRPVTQADKRRRLGLAGARSDEISFVAADLLDADLSQKLTAGGHDPAQPTIWLCEGVLSYLTAAQIEQLCRAVMAISAPESTLALNALVEARHTWHDWISSRLADLFLGAVGEPRGDRLHPGQMEDILQHTGWSVAAGGERGPVRGDGTVMMTIAAVAVGR